MQTEWFMLMAMGYSANVRLAITARLRHDEAEETIHDMLRHDPDAERAHILRSQVTENGIRKWVPVTTIRRTPDGALIPIGAR